MAIYICIHKYIYIRLGRQCGLPFQALGLSSLSVVQPMTCSAAAQWPRQNVWGTRCRCVKAPAQGMAQPYLVLAPGSAPKLWGQCLIASSIFIFWTTLIVQRYSRGQWPLEVHFIQFPPLRMLSLIW